MIFPNNAAWDKETMKKKEYKFTIKKDYRLVPDDWNSKHNRDQEFLHADDFFKEYDRLKLGNNGLADSCVELVDEVEKLNRQIKNLEEQKRDIVKIGDSLFVTIEKLKQELRIVKKQRDNYIDRVVNLRRQMHSNARTLYSYGIRFLSEADAARYHQVSLWTIRSWADDPNNSKVYWR